MQEIEIPQTLDDPPLALIFNAHQFMTVMGFAMIGAMIDRMIVLTILGFVLGSLFTKFSDRKPSGYLRHKLHWWGLPTMSMKRSNGLDRVFRP